MPIVLIPETLFHGTGLDNIVGLLKTGLVPGGGTSPHRTKTRDAVFLTDSMENALMYSNAGQNDAPIVILEIDPADMPIEPDYDDVGIILSIDLDELNNELGLDEDLELGYPIPEEMIDRVQRTIENISDFSERAEPFTISMEYSNDIAFLYTEPYICMGVNNKFVMEIPELYDDLTFEDSRPCLVFRQYLCKCKIPLDRIKAFYLDDYAIKILNTLTPLFSINKPSDMTTVTDYGNFSIPVDEDGNEINVKKLQYNDPILGEVSFKEITLYRFQVKDLLK